MSSIAQSIGVIAWEAKNGLRQHLRSKALWFMGLATPIAANFMVPGNDADYAVLTINGMYPNLTPSMLGLELGVITATLLTPIAYLFLRAGATRRRPTQISDVTPYSRISAAIGRWFADVAILWFLLGALTVAGWVLGFLRLPSGEWNLWHTAVALWLPAAPALALVAATRTILDARPILTRWPGDVLFFFLWIGFMVAGILASSPSGGVLMMKPMMDPYGYITPIIQGAPYPVENFSIGSSANVTNKTEIDALKGVLNTSFLISRLFWMIIGLFMVTFAGMVYKERKPRKISRFNRLRAKVTAAINPTVKRRALSSPVLTAKPATVPYVGLILSEIKLIFNNNIWLIAIILAAILGAIFPYREIAAPAIWLALIFPLTTQSGRGQMKTLRVLYDTSISNEAVRSFAFCAAGILILFTAHIPAIGKLFVDGGNYAQFTLMAKIIIGVPLSAMAFAYISKGAIVGRLVLFIAWYVFLSSV